MRSWLWVGFGLVLVCLACITALADAELRGSVEQVRASAQNQWEEGELTRDMAKQVARADTALLSAVVLTEPDDLKFQREVLTQAFAAYAQAEKALLARPSAAGGELADLARGVQGAGADTRRSLDTLIDRIGDPAEREMMGAFVANTMQPNFEAWQDSLQRLEVARKQGAERDTARVKQQVASARHSLLAFAALAGLVGLLSAVLISRQVLGPLASAVRLAEHVAQGDLSMEIQAGQGGEIGALVQALGTMQHSLSGLVSQVQHSSDGITLASREIAQGHQDLSQRTELTASQLQQASSSMAQLVQGINHTAQAAQRASTLATQARDTAVAGGQAVAKVVDSMNAIQQASRQIDDITAAINSLAFRTNLLALNASVEAARAGDQGRGFAVVADEVRSLAQRSAEAAKEISALVSGNVATVQSGTQMVHSAAQTMDSILRVVDQVNAIVAEISTASNGQSQEARSVGAMVMQLDDMTQQNAALVEQGAAASVSLHDETEHMRQLTQLFKLPARP